MSHLTWLVGFTGFQVPNAPSVLIMGTEARAVQHGPSRPGHVCVSYTQCACCTRRRRQELPSLSSQNSCCSLNACISRCTGGENPIDPTSIPPSAASRQHGFLIPWLIHPFENWNDILDSPLTPKKYTTHPVKCSALGGRPPRWDPAPLPATLLSPCGHVFRCKFRPSGCIFFFVVKNGLRMVSNRLQSREEHQAPPSLHPPGSQLSRSHCWLPIFPSFLP